MPNEYINDKRVVWGCFFLQLMDENKWYEYDDSRVTAIDESEIKTSAAYVLFYRRVRSESENVD